jgi:sRNA-binding regulator protein Hfq
MRRYEPGNQAPPPGNSTERGNADPGHRKLIRPNLSELKDRMVRGGTAVPRRKQVPPTETNAEAFYYLKQMNSRTPMVVVLKDGEELRGIIEWYDRTCIKVNRTGAPNLMVMKDTIKYMYKEDELKDDTNPTPDGI